MVFVCTKHHKCHLVVCLKDLDEGGIEPHISYQGTPPPSAFILYYSWDPFTSILRNMHETVLKTITVNYDETFHLFI